MCPVCFFENVTGTTMVADAEKYKAEDDANKNRVESKNNLENYCYSLKSSIGSDEIKDKIPADDKAKLETAEELTWVSEGVHVCVCMCACFEQSIPP